MKEVMNFYSITNYRYDCVSKTLLIYQPILVDYFLDIKLTLKNKVRNIIVKEGRI